MASRGFGPSGEDSAATTIQSLPPRPSLPPDLASHQFSVSTPSPDTPLVGSFTWEETPEPDLGANLRQGVPGFEQGGYVGGWPGTDNQYRVGFGEYVMDRRTTAKYYGELEQMRLGQDEPEPLEKTPNRPILQPNDPLGSVPEVDGPGKPNRPATDIPYTGETEVKRGVSVNNNLPAVQDHRLGAALPVPPKPYTSYQPPAVLRPDEHVPAAFTSRTLDYSSARSIIPSPAPDPGLDNSAQAVQNLSQQQLWKLRDNKAEVLREVQDALAKAEVLRSLRSRLHVP